MATRSGACESCWHAISREQKGGRREFDDGRAARALWCFAIIAHATAPEVTHWVDLHGGHERRLYLWLRTENYVVILAESMSGVERVYRFVTSFPMTQKGYERTLRGSFARRVSET